MSKFFDETMQGLLEAVAVDQGKVKLGKKRICQRPHFALQTRNLSFTVSRKNR